jgi:O-antigen ligase
VITISATGARSFGIDLLLSRVAGDADGGSAELSVLSRELRLPVIFEKINLHPIAGNGIGSRLDVYDPVTETNVSTTQYDWGYLEMISELGIIGTVLLCALWFYTAIRIALQARKENHPSERIFKWGIFAGVVGLCVANIFAPIMYHAMGIIFLIVVLILISEKLSLIRRIGVSLEALAQK